MHKRTERCVATAIRGRSTARILKRAAAVTFVLASSGTLPAVARAALAPEGPEFQVNAVTSGFQGFSSVCRAPDGSFVAVFVSGLDVSGRRYDATGQAVGGEFAVSTDTASVKAAPVAACSDGDGFRVAWESLEQDGSDSGVFARRFDGAGAPIGGEFQVNTYTSGDQHRASICSDGAGGFTVVWEDGAQDGSLEGVFGQRFDGDGLASGDEFQLNAGTTSAQSAPALCCDAAGGVVAVWESEGADGSSFAVVGRRYDSAGGPIGDEFLVNTHTESSQANPAVCCDGTGGFVVAWESLDQDDPGGQGGLGGVGVFGQRYDDGGQRIGDEFQANVQTAGDQLDPALGCLPDGGFLISWNAAAETPAGAQDVFARRYGSSGSAEGGEFQVNSYTTGAQAGSSVGADGSGSFVVAWDSDGQDGSGYGVFAQLLAPVCDSAAECDDGNACTADSCEPGGPGADPFGCVNAEAVLCTALDQCHDIGTCDPGTGECSNPAKADGTTCADGSACTQVDTCQTGVCVGASPVACTALDQCHDVGVCDPQTGTCSNPEKANGTACVDGNACTQEDTCQAGVCVGASPVVCTALDQCHDVGVCDPQTGTCSDPEKANGTACVDGNACTQVDTCQAGICVGASPVVCTALDQCHDIGTCDPATGACSNPEKVNGTACIDGNACTQEDTCQAGICVGASPVVCTALDQCHNAGVCDPATGECSNPEKVDGTVCVDGDACTQEDTCQAGICVGASPVVCTALDQCHDAGVCDPQTGTCSNPEKANGTACIDGNACTQVDTCQTGVCVGASPVVCMALDQCHDAGVCDPQTGTCSNPAKADGTTCADGSACTQVDTCETGVCVGASPVVCTALDQCHDVGTCDPQTGTCSNPEKANGTACIDGNACTQEDTCQAGICVGASPVVCTALDQCHDAGMCDPQTGTCSNPAKADGTTCADGSACTQEDTCQAGACVGASPVVCTALDQCHDAGMCDPQTGTCSNPAKADGTACVDGNACTQVDTCQTGVCVGASPVVCTALDQCHDAGVCDPQTGTCSNPAKVDGTTCADGNACTQVDTCQAGTCVGASPVACTALDQCHDAGTCDPDTGKCSNPPVSDGTSCDDHNACTRQDTCTAGECTGGDPVVCPALAQCFEAGTCNPATGVCSAPLKPDGTSCGRACLRGGACRKGQCVGATEPVICTAIDDCHEAGSCESSTGLCTNPIKPSGTTCDDGNACTQTDRCQSGTCVGADPVECVAADVCHVAGICDPQSGDCSDPPGPDGTACDDGDSCTVLDACAAGACRGRLTGFDEVQCEVDLLQPATVCAPEELPKKLSRFIDKKLKRAVKALARAQQASEADKTGKMQKQLDRFAKLVAAIRQKTGDFTEEGLGAPCAARVDGIAAELTAFVEAMRI